MAIKLNEKDQQDLYQNYPDLNCSLPRGMVWGTLKIACSYDQDNKELVYNDSANNYIVDSYEIRIDFNRLDKFSFPKVYEESEIIKEYANDNRIRLVDLHINKNDDDSCCLGIFPEYQWQGVLAFLRDKVVPFFYWQSFMRKYGQKSWEDYSHDEYGIVEAMTLHPDESSKSGLRNISCPCGSGKKYKKCCMQRDALLKSKISNPDIARRK